MVLRLSETAKEKMLEIAMSARYGRDEGGMQRKLEPISVNKYNTPTAANRDNSYSVGIMNLTEDEVEAIIAFAQAVQRERSMPFPPSFNKPYRPVVSNLPSEAYIQQETRAAWAREGRNEAERRAALLQSIINDKDDDRRKLLTGQVADLIEPEKPEAPRNRFSGLDIE